MHDFNQSSFVAGKKSPFSFQYEHFKALKSLKLSLYVYKMECIESNGSSFIGNIDCNLKMISRGQSVITFMVDLIKPLNYINTNIAVVWKSSSNTFSNTIINGTFELCKSLSSMPAMLKLIVPIITKYAPNLIHACPYIGLLHLKSIKLFVFLDVMISRSTWSYKLSHRHKHGACHCTWNIRKRRISHRCQLL